MYLTDEETHEQSPQKILTIEGLCRWCDSIFSLDTIKSVCDSCHKLLIGANLSDEEIFGDQGRSNENASE